MEAQPQYLVIPAAGLGTRMRPVNPDMPKEMLPIGHRPAIQYTVAEGHSAGIRDIIIIINRDKELIRQYFVDSGLRKSMFPDDSGEVDKILESCSLTFRYQERPLGESDAIGYAADIVGNSSLAIIYPDCVYAPSPGALKILIPFFRQYRSDIAALMEVKEENAHGISNSGRADVEHIKNSIYRIKKILPKGEGHFKPRFKGEMRTCGITISGPHIFEYINKLRSTITEEEFTDVPLRDAMLREKGMIGCRLPGIVFDIGNPIGYSLCLQHLQ
jgi:UTP--glucose-1-phosphate uridylyltransferase